MMEATCSSETSVLTRVKRRNVPEDGNLHIYSYGFHVRPIHILRNILALEEYSGIMNSLNIQFINFKILYDVAEWDKKQTNSVAFSPRANYTD
jgi:hypothetical protein